MRGLVAGLMMMGAVALVVSPVSAQSVPTAPPGTQQMSFLNYCTSGALRACASAVVRTMWVDPDPSVSGDEFNQITLFVRNEQGTLSTDNTDGSFVTKVGLTSPELEGELFQGATVDGSVESVGAAAAEWRMLKSPGPGNIGGNGLEFTLGTQGTEGAIRGCDPSNANPDNYFRICDPQGFTGWVAFSFTTTNQWDASEAQVAWKFQSIGPNDVSLACRSEDGVNCQPTMPPSTVVPEPMTIALLGTGLFGIGGVRLRRRRAAVED